MEVVINDVFYFVLHFSGDQVRRWSRVVGAVGLVFMIGSQQRGMEDIIDGPGYRKLKLIGDR